MASKNCSKKRRHKQYKARDKEFLINPIGAAMMAVGRISEDERSKHIDLINRAIDLLEIDMCPRSEYNELVCMAGVSVNLAMMGVCCDEQSQLIIHAGADALAEIGVRMNEKRTPIAMRSHIECIAALRERYEIQLLLATAGDLERARSKHMAERNLIRSSRGLIEPAQEMAVAS